MSPPPSDESRRPLLPVNGEDPYGTQTRFVVPNPAIPQRSRVLALDLVRGIILSLAALDSVRLSFMEQSDTLFESWQGLPNYHGNFSLFILRFLTHICAPGFFFLLGTSLVLLHDARRYRRYNPWTEQDVITHFFKRGLLLLFLSVTAFNSGLYYHQDGTWIVLGVIFALSLNYIIGGITCVFLETKMPQDYDLSQLFQPLSFGRLFEGLWEVHWKEITLLLIADLLLILAELVAPPPSFPPNQVGWIAAITLINTTKNHLKTIYPFLPWLSFTLYGIAYGRVIRYATRVQSAKFNLVLSLISGIAFASFRYAEGFGNLILPPEGVANSWIDLFNLVKYPPTIVYAASALFFLHLLLALSYLIPEQNTEGCFAGRFTKDWLCPFLLDYGKSSLFFFFTQWWLYQFFAWFNAHFLGLKIYHSVLPIYMFWMLGLAWLWPLCRWWSDFKAAQHEKSVWRLL